MSQPPSMADLFKEYGADWRPVAGDKWGGERCPICGSVFEADGDDIDRRLALLLELVTQPEVARLAAEARSAHNKARRDAARWKHKTQHAQEDVLEMQGRIDELLVENRRLHEISPGVAPGTQV